MNANELNVDDFIVFDGETFQISGFTSDRDAICAVNRDGKNTLIKAAACVKKRTQSWSHNADEELIVSKRKIQAVKDFIFRFWELGTLYPPASNKEKSRRAGEENIVSEIESLIR